MGYDRIVGDLLTRDPFASIARRVFEDQSRPSTANDLQPENLAASTAFACFWE